MTPFLFGPAQRRLHGVYHPATPANRRAQQVLLCPPFGREAVRTHRLHRLLAEALTDQGCHVLRFDYHGTGESSGEDTDASITGWQDDILVAQDELSQRARATETVWVGTRLGGALALLASVRGATKPHRIVLWEPVLDGPAYARELGKAHAEHAFDPFIHRHRPAPELRSEVLGFGVSDRWIQELHALSPGAFEAACLQGCHHIGTRLDRDAEALSARLQARGLGWRHTRTSVEMAWHVEEASGAALAPPELVRSIAAAVKGDAP